MPSLTLLTRKTVTSQLLKAAICGTLLGNMLAISYAGITAVNWIRNMKSPESYTAYNIQKALAEKKIALAKEIWDTALIKESEGTWQFHDLERASLTIAVKKAVLEEDLERRLAAFQLGRAEDALEKIIGSRLFNVQEVEDFRQRMYEQTEGGLAQTISLERVVSKKIVLAERYLTAYPKGVRRDVVLEGLLIEWLDQTFLTVTSSPEYISILQHVMDLNRALKTYAARPVPVAYNLDNLILKVGDYLKGNVTDQTFFIRRMLVQVVNPQPSKWNQDYYAQRQATIPKGSLGVVLDIGIEDKVAVRFEKANDAWNNEWRDLSKYWKDGKKNVSFYHSNPIT